MSQEEITIWEKENSEKIIGWEIHYGENSDKIIFKMNDGTKEEFERNK
jgi:hypothetical protein